MAAPDAWTETAFVSIAIAGGNYMTFQAMTETIDIDIGEKGVEFIPNVAGGRVAKFNPQEPVTITMEAYPTEGGTLTSTTGPATGYFDLLYTATTTTTTTPQSITSDRTRLRTRIAFLWTNDTAVTTATGTTATGKSSLRAYFDEGYITKVNPSFTDGVLKFTIEAIYPPFNKSGTGKITIESIDETSQPTATLSALSAYT